MPHPSNATILALDFGGRRIGVAIAGLHTKLPQPFGVVEQSDAVIDDIKKLITEHAVVAVVLGLPRGLSGQETNQTLEVRNFATKLQSSINTPLYLQDEALTSQKAEEELKMRGVRYNKQDVDALAATYILEDFLHEHPGIENEQLQASSN